MTAAERHELEALQLAAIKAAEADGNSPETVGALLFDATQRVPYPKSTTAEYRQSVIDARNVARVHFQRWLPNGWRRLLDLEERSNVF